MYANFHPMIYLIDYVMGMIMWTLIGRVAMNIFQREDSSFFFMKVFVKLTDPLISVFTSKFSIIMTLMSNSDQANEQINYISYFYMHVNLCSERFYQYIISI